jgi:hypothetical protein
MSEEHSHSGGLDMETVETVLMIVTLAVGVICVAILVEKIIRESSLLNGPADILVFPEVDNAEVE